VPGRTGEAVSEVDNVNVIADPKWNGDPEILEYVTPIKVTINNNSDHELLLQYRDFSLVSEKGSYYAALPPYQITGTLQDPAPAHEYPRIVRPGFRHRRFFIAPYYGRIYPGIPPFRFGPRDGFPSFDPFFDPFYFHNYPYYWRNTPLPTPFMLQEAIPEGVIDPGGFVMGYVYFQKVNPEAKKVIFQLDLQDKGHVAFGTVSIPFTVKKQ
jgi:hypothetical protein